jgi:hypothetical protein
LVRRVQHGLRRDIHQEAASMRTASFVAAACAFGAATFAMIPRAHALGPVDLEVGARAGFATSPVSSSNGGSGPNPLGFGVGARGGVSFLGIYGGISIIYYFGSSDNVSVPGIPGITPGESVSVSRHTLMYGIEAGYGFTLVDVLTIRPQIGIGNASLGGSVSGSGIVNTNASAGNESSLYIEPGITGLVSLGSWYVGADANLLFFTGLTENSTTAFSFHGQIGLKF